MGYSERSSRRQAGRPLGCVGGQTGNLSSLELTRALSLGQYQAVEPGLNPGPARNAERLVGLQTLEKGKYSREFEIPLL